jgi:hypothetical protein
VQKSWENNDANGGETVRIRTSTKLALFARELASHPYFMFFALQDFIIVPKVADT